MKREVSMTGKRIYLILQAALWTLLAALLIAGAVGLYREGMALRAAGDVAAPLFTRERVAGRLAKLAPLAGLALGLTLVGLALGVRDARRRPAACGKIPVRGEEPRRTARLRLVLLALAAAMIALGACNGGARDVLYKAVNICTECVGLG